MLFFNDTYLYRKIILCVCALKRTENTEKSDSFAKMINMKRLFILQYVASTTRRLTVEYKIYNVSRLYIFFLKKNSMNEIDITNLNQKKEAKVN